MSSTETAPDPTATTNGVVCSVLGSISGHLLRRLGEAEKGYDDGKPHWFVSRLEAVQGEFDIQPCFSAEEANTAYAALKDPGRYGVFGPFVTPVDHPRPVVIPDVPTVVLEGGGSGLLVPSLMLRNTPITKIVVTRKVKGVEKDLVIDPDAFDAIFWGTTSVKKFAIPYYSASNSLEYAIKVHNDFFVNGAYLLAHKPDTEYDVFQAGAGVTLDGGETLSPVV